MRNENFVEMFDWDKKKLVDATGRVLSWYSGALKIYGSGGWFREGMEKLTPILAMVGFKDRRVYEPVVFEGFGVSLTYYYQFMVPKFGEIIDPEDRAIFESNPHFVFSTSNGELLPREINTILKTHREVGKEAEEVLGADYSDGSGVISFPARNFAKLIYKGRIPLIGVNKSSVDSEVDEILQNLDF